MRAGGPDFFELDLLVRVEAVGVTQDPAGDLADLRRLGNGGRRDGERTERAQVGDDRAEAAAVAQRTDLAEQL